MANIIGGPYTLYKEEGSGDKKIKGVISLCIMDGNKINERLYTGGKLTNEFARNQKSLNEALSYMI